MDVYVAGTVDCGMSGQSFDLRDALTDLTLDHREVIGRDLAAGDLQQLDLLASHDPDTTAPRTSPLSDASTSIADPRGHPRALGIFWSVIAQECPMVNESIEPARWGEPVSDRAIATTEGHLHAQLPPAWRAYLQSQRWLRRGWLESGDYIHLYDPEESLEIMDAWGDSTALHPGIYFLGGDGSRSIYCVDLRDAEPAVQLTDIAGGGWMDAEPLLDSVEQFVAAISDGTFRAFQEG